MSRVSASTGLSGAARAASNAKLVLSKRLRTLCRPFLVGHLQGTQQYRWARGARRAARRPTRRSREGRSPGKPVSAASHTCSNGPKFFAGREAPLRMACFVARRLSGVTTRRSLLRASPRKHCHGALSNMSLSITVLAKAASRPCGMVR